MRSTHIALGAALILACAVAPRAVAAQDAQAKAVDLLAQARKALGGDDKLRAVKSLQANGSFKRMAGNNNLDGDLDIEIQLPDKYRRNESVDGPFGQTIDRTEALNGADMWNDTNRSGGPGGGGFGGGFGRGGDRGGGFGGGGFGGGRPGGPPPAAGGDAQGGNAGAPAGARGQFDPERLRQLQLQMRRADFSRLLIALLLSTDAPATWVGTAQSPEGNADVVEIKRADGDATRVFLDQKTHIPLMLTWQGPAFAAGRGGRGGRGRGGAQAQGDVQAQPPAPPVFAMHLGDYKSVNGIRLPFTITRSVNDETIEDVSMKSYKVNPAFKADTFAQPKK